MRKLNEYFKVPNFKFKKIKMENAENIDDFKKNNSKEKKKNYEKTNYNTIKEVFIRSREKYSDGIFILQKFNPKENFKEITYREFTDDVIALGTSLTKKYNSEASINTYFNFFSGWSFNCISL